MIAKTQIDFHGTIGTSDPAMTSQDLAQQLFELELIFNGQGGNKSRIHIFGGKQESKSELVLQLLKGRVQGAEMLLKNARSERLQSLIKARLQEAESILMSVEALFDKELESEKKP